MTLLWRTPRNRWGLIAHAIVLLVLTPTVAYLSAVWIGEPLVCTTAIVDEARIAAYGFLPYLTMLLILASIRYKPNVFILSFSRSLWEIVALVSTLPGLILCIPFVAHWLGLQRWVVALAYVLMMHLLLLLRAAISNKQGRATDK